ncbi:MAG: hypothetical protein IAF38_07865 [Bacteroidia bacterium]|nr:hypothetical protein [Bacteroidia bacterium]
MKFTDQKANDQKKKAIEKFDEASKANLILSKKINGTDTSKGPANEVVQAEIDKKNTLADDLQGQARAKRTEAKGKTGKEKDDLIKEAVVLEQKAVEARLEATKTEIDLHDKKLEENSVTLTELKEKTGDKSGPELKQAKILEEEAKKLVLKAEGMRKSAQKETDDGPKLGGLTNASEADREALIKQNQAIEIYKKYNPDYVASGKKNAMTPEQIKKAIEENDKIKNEAMVELAQANKTELAALQVQVGKSQNTSDNKKDEEAAKWKKQAADLVKQADVEIAKAKTEKDPVKKNELLAEAIKKQEDAIILVNSAKIKYEGGDPIVYNDTVKKTNTAKTQNELVADSIKIKNEQIAKNQLADSLNAAKIKNEQIVKNTPGDTSKNSAKTGGIGNLSPEKVEEIKKSPEYKKYQEYQSKITKAEDNIKRDKTRAQKLMDDATANMKLSNDYRIKADGMPDGKEKNDLKAKAIEIEHLALKSKFEADSLNELASNTEGYLKEQKAGADDYTASLDQKTRENIQTVANAKTATTPVIQQPDSANTPVVTAKYAANTPAFKTNAEQHDKAIETFKNQEPNEQNLNTQNTELKNYSADVDKEIAEQKKNLAKAKTAAEKTKINNVLAELLAKKNDMKQQIASNTDKIAKIKADNAIVIQPVKNDVKDSTPKIKAIDPVINPVVTPVASNGLKVKDGNAYSTANPIPIDQRWPDGVVFTVQVAAFKTPLENNVFKGLTPIMGTTAPSGYIRYQAGMFEKFNEANAAKNDVRKLGFKDAFVAVYKNGKRITLAEAMTEMGTTAIADNNATLGINPNNNTPDGNVIIPQNSEVKTAVASTDVAQMNGMFYSVQIGVYGNSVSPSQVKNLAPIYQELIPSGNYRYAAGVYNNLDKVKADKQKVNAIGIKDAFVTVYYNGKRITFTEANQKQAAGGVQFLPENPIRFDGSNAGTTNAIVTPENNSVTPTNNIVTPTNNGNGGFSNGVSSDPVPTPENGVKLTNEGVVYKIQIGAYSKQVPSTVSRKWMNIKTWPIRNYNNSKGLFIYTVGSFGDFANAKKLLNESLGLGISDAFITVFKDGVRQYGDAAAQYMK